MENVRQRRNISEENLVTSDEKISSGVTKNVSNQRWLRVLLFLPLIILLPLQFAYVLSPISAVLIDGVEDVTLDGAFAVNKKLSFGKKIAMFAPESIVEDHLKNLYVGLRDGKVVKIHPSSTGVIGEGEMEVMAEGKIHDDPVRGDHSDALPLGIRLRGSLLYIMDALYGLYTLDLKTRERKVLIKPDSTSPAMKFPNDLDITADGKTIYFTDSSSLHTIHELIPEALEGTCSGRLFAYDVATKEIRTILKDLCFANGVQLTRDEKMMIVPETTRYRVSWIDVVTGMKKHVLHVPAMPDNVRRNRRGSHWIGASAKLEATLKYSFNYPVLRQLAVGLLPHDFLMRIPNRKHNMLFEVNDQGEIFSTRHDPSGNLTYALSQATELSDGRLALGSYAAPYLAIADKQDNDY